MVFFDVFDHFTSVVVRKWRHLEAHLIQYYAKLPNIHLFPILELFYLLLSHVAKGTTETIPLSQGLNSIAKVCYFSV